jgi:hypothetical protein
VALESIPPRLPLVSYGVVSGRVLSPEGEPLASINVTAQGHSMGIGVQIVRTVTDGNGTFRMAVPIGHYTVSSRGSESFPERCCPLPPFFDVYGPGEVAQVPILTNRETSGVDLYLPRERRFRATVTVVGDAGPVSDGRVDWRSDDDGRGFSARLDEDGVADLGPLAPGQYRLWATAGEKPQQLAGTTTIQIEDSPLEHVVINVFPGGRLNGRLVDHEGRPFRVPRGSQFKVIPNSLGSHSLTYHPDYEVEPDGRFALTGLIGDVCLVVTGENAHAAQIVHQGADMTDRAFSIDYGELITDVMIRMAPGSFVQQGLLPCEP